MGLTAWITVASAIALLSLSGCAHRRAPPPQSGDGRGALPAAAPLGASEPAVLLDGIEIGQRAPDFVLTSFDGRSISLADFRGKPVVIDFWAAWCPFCLGEFPVLERAYQTNRAGGLVVLGIHRSDGEDQATGARFAAERGVTFPLLQDEGDRVYRQFSGGTPAMPLSYFIDRDGIIRAKIFGPKTDERIREYLARIR